MHWFYMFLAIVAEIFSTSLIKMTMEFTRLVPSVLVVLGYGVSFYCFSLALRVIPVGIGYAIWCGIGMFFVALIGFFAYGQRLDMPAVLGLGLIIAGTLIINLFSKSIGH